MSLALLLSLTCCLSQAGQAAQPADPAVQGNAPTEPAPDGLWPSERLIELMIQRWAAEASHEYELTDTQHSQIEARMLDRWPRFMRENRSTIQPLVNEFIEARMGLEPPAQERVQDWAGRALPVFDAFREQIDAGLAEVEALLTPAQRKRYSAQKIKTGLEFDAFRQRIAQWKSGQYTPAEWWDPPAGRSASRQAGASDAKQAPSEPPDQIALELDAWDRFVADVVSQYRFDPSQKAAARSILKEQKEKAVAHRDRHRDQIVQLERRLAIGQPDDADQVSHDLQRLYGPIDALFQDLERRVRLIPTQSQRQAATQPAEEPTGQDAPVERR
ncbi:MAG: hypothetical protein IID40_06315 [Planctomycetes bacterium]|nr:hypothetical protein [Planctomycetota bacterium]